jgi:RNA polymerase sigma-70 factor, ECF subfamily
VLVSSVEPELDVVDLVRAAQSGDRAAFGALYRRYARMVHGVLLASVSYTHAEDLVQDVFVIAMHQIGSLRDASAVGGWLASIARRTATDHHRISPPVTLSDYHAPRSFQPPDEARAALEAIRQLPLPYRETLVLRLVEGMTGPEIAARTGMTADSVRVNLCRGMKLLRAALGGHQS